MAQLYKNDAREEEAVRVYVQKKNELLKESR